MEEQVAVEDFYIDYGKMDALQRKYVDKKVNKGEWSLYKKTLKHIKRARIPFENWSEPKAIDTK